MYDAVGNFLEMQHHGTHPTHPGWRRAYAYGETSLIEDGTGGAQFKTSNRLSSTTVGNNNPAPERCVYDAHGNTIRMPHLGGAHPAANMHWDHDDQLGQTDLGGGGTAYYVHDATGQRVRKVWEKSANLVEERLYLGGFEIYRRRQGAARLERETLHIMDDKQRIALVETRILDTAGDDPAPRQLIRYQYGSHLGSTTLELDDQAQIISYEEYTPYGSTSYQAVRNQTEASKRYRYTGKERDEESGLYYHGARYYAPWLARWISCDAAGLVDGPNLYGYSLESPIRLADPSGHQSGPPKLPKPSGPWDVDADRIVRREYIAGSGKWKSPPDMRANANKLAEITGFDPKTTDLGHDPETPHWKQRAGDRGQLRNERALGPGGNRSRGATSEGPAAKGARARGQYARVGGADPTAPPGARKTAMSVPAQTSATPSAAPTSAAGPTPTTPVEPTPTTPVEPTPTTPVEPTPPISPEPAIEAGHAEQKAAIEAGHAEQKAAIEAGRASRGGRSMLRRITSILPIVGALSRVMLATQDASAAEIGARMIGSELGIGPFDLELLYDHFSEMHQGGREERELRQRDPEYDREMREAARRSIDFDRQQSVGRPKY